MRRVSGEIINLNYLARTDWFAGLWLDVPPRTSGVARTPSAPGRPHECVVASPTTAPDAKKVVNFHSTTII